MKFVTVDDDPVFLEIMEGTLRNLGFDEIVSALSADQALNVATSGAFSPDCFLVDIQMPGKNGIDLVRELRAIETYRQTPIVMVTRMSDKAYIDDAFTAGATDYVTKPLDNIEFRSRIGMVQRLHDERKRSAMLLEQRGLDADGQFAADFSAPVLIPEMDNCVDFLALENYLLTLGRSRTVGYAAVSFNITNARFFHQACDYSVFLEMLADVSHAIFHNIKSHQFLLSYVGNGNIVVLLDNAGEVDTTELQYSLNHTLMEYESAYTMDRLPVPQVRAGRIMRSGVFSIGRPTSILYRALADVAPDAAHAANAGRLVA